MRTLQLWFAVVGIIVCVGLFKLIDFVPHYFVPLPPLDATRAPFSKAEIPVAVRGSLSNATLARTDALLTLELVQRASHWDGLDEHGCAPGIATNWCKVLQRLTRGECLTVFVCGGSQSRDQHGIEWHKPFAKWFSNRYVCKGNHTFGYHADSGHGSDTHLGSLGMIYTARMVPLGKPVDILILELGTNDFPARDLGPIVEALVLSFLVMQPEMAISIVSAFHHATNDGVIYTAYNQTTEAKFHWVIARHLKMPFISFPLAMFSTPVTKSNGQISNLYVENERDPSSPAYRGNETYCGEATENCVLFTDGFHLTAVGGSYFAMMVANFFANQTLRISHISSVPQTKINITTLLTHSLYADTPTYAELDSPSGNYITFSTGQLPQDFVAPKGWTMVSDTKAIDYFFRPRYGLAAFGACTDGKACIFQRCKEAGKCTSCSSKEEYAHCFHYLFVDNNRNIFNSSCSPSPTDVCSEPIEIDLGNHSSLVINYLMSYRGMSIATVGVSAPLSIEYCGWHQRSESILNSTSCLLDGLWPNSFPWAVSVPQSTKIRVKRPPGFGGNIRLSLHVLNVTKADQFTAADRVNKIRDLGKFKILGWYIV